MHDTHYLGDVLIFLAAAVVTVALFRRIKVSPVLGYLAAGVVIGPYGFAFIRDVEAVRGLAELGVVFLLFMIGLELSFARLRVMRGQVFGLGTAQVAVTGLVLGGCAWLAGLDSRTAIVIGAALALSSTAVVLQLLGEQGEIAGRAGRVALAILLFQDLAVVPLLVLVPQFGQSGEAILISMGLALVKAALALAVIVVMGRLLLRPLFHAIARERIPELLIGLTLLVVLGASFATEHAGLSLALGAFLAGLLLAETEFRHQVEADIEPFRGLLLSLFFMTVGMTIDFGVLADHALLLVAIIAGILVLKAASIGLVALAFRLPFSLAVRQALLLAECGEFAFILFSLAASHGVMDDGLSRILILAVAVTMALTPALNWLGRKLEARFTADPGGVESLETEAEDLRNHVLVLGFGRVGQVVARLLTTEGVPWVALDQDPVNVARGRVRGQPVYFGDASSNSLLRAAGAERARAVAVTMNDPHAVVRTVALLRMRFSDLPIYARARDEDHCRELEKIGASGIVPEIMEVSLQLGGKVLGELGLGDDDVVIALNRVRAEGDLTPTGEGPPRKD